MSLRAHLETEALHWALRSAIATETCRDIAVRAGVHPTVLSRILRRSGYPSENARTALSVALGVRLDMESKP